MANVIESDLRWTDPDGDEWRCVNGIMQYRCDDGGWLDATPGVEYITKAREALGVVETQKTWTDPSGNQWRMDPERSGEHLQFRLKSRGAWDDTGHDAGYGINARLVLGVEGPHIVGRDTLPPEPMTVAEMRAALRVLQMVQASDHVDVVVTVSISTLKMVLGAKEE